MAIRIPHQVKFFLEHDSVKGFVPSEIGNRRVEAVRLIIDYLTNNPYIEKIGIGIYNIADENEVIILCLLNPEILNHEIPIDDIALWKDILREVSAIYPNVSKEEVIRQAKIRYLLLLYQERVPNLLKETVQKKYGVDVNHIKVNFIFDESKFDSMPFMTSWSVIYDKNFGLLTEDDDISYDVFEILSTKQINVKVIREDAYARITFIKSLKREFSKMNIDFTIEIERHKGVNRIVVKILSDPHNKAAGAVTRALAKAGLKSVPEEIKIVKKV